MITIVLLLGNGFEKRWITYLKYLLKCRSDIICSIHQNQRKVQPTMRILIETWCGSDQIENICIDGGSRAGYLAIVGDAPLVNQLISGTIVHVYFFDGELTVLKGIYRNGDIILELRIITEVRIEIGKMHHSCIISSLAEVANCLPTQLYQR